MLFPCLSMWYWLLFASTCTPSLYIHRYIRIFFHSFIQSNSVAYHLFPSDCRNLENVFHSMHFWKQLDVAWRNALVRWKLLHKRYCGLARCSGSESMSRSRLSDTLSIMIRQLISKKTIIISFSFDVLIRAFFILGAVKVFQCIHWRLFPGHNGKFIMENLSHCFFVRIQHVGNHTNAQT